MRILIINGPNLNLLGERETNVYGSETLDQINNWILNHELCKSLNIEFFQSNSEGKIIDFLHSNRKNSDYCIINPGALTHYSYSLRDAIESVQIPTVEIHLSNIMDRESFRKTSVIKDICIGQVFGRGKKGYLDAINILCEYKENQL